MLSLPLVLSFVHPTHWHCTCVPNSRTHQQKLINGGCAVVPTLSFNTLEGARIACWQWDSYFLYTCESPSQAKDPLGRLPLTLPAVGGGGCCPLHAPLAPEVTGDLPIHRTLSRPMVGLAAWNSAMPLTAWLGGLIYARSGSLTNTPVPICYDFHAYPTRTFYLFKN